jgi:hypothetical protein
MSYPQGAPTSGAPGIIRVGDSVENALEELRAHLDAWNVALALSNCVYPLGTVVNPDLCDAIARAINDWIIEAWLERDPRLRASLVVPPGAPAPAPGCRRALSPRAARARVAPRSRGRGRSG